MRLQFSLRELLFIIAVVALGCGGLLHPSAYAESFAFTFTIVLLFVAVLGAIARKGSARVFWLGAAVAGWGYLWMAHWSDPESPILPNWELQTNGPLLTTRLLRAACDRLHPAPPPQGSGMGMFSLRPERPGNQNAPPQLFGGQPVNAPPVTVVPYERLLAAFMRVGHCLWTLIFAYLGARLACYLYRTASPTAERSASPR